MLAGFQYGRIAADTREKGVRRLDLSGSSYKFEEEALPFDHGARVATVQKLVTFLAGPDKRHFSVLHNLK
jgi:hypothetical protein